jgi:hypothetical protein
MRGLGRPGQLFNPLVAADDNRQRLADVPFGDDAVT